MDYIFGPVPSRRLGLSLGIDPTPTPDSAQKACNWNCVYCQLGRTRSFTTTRRRFFPPQKMLDELRAALETEEAKGIDWITFVGSGEPALNSDLGLMIREVKAVTDIPVAVITNGSFLGDTQFRIELSAADAVMPTVDAGTATQYRQINRAHPGFCFEHHIRGLTKFRKEYSGKLWIELMLISGVNDDEASLRAIAEALNRIGPDEVHLLLPTRPPTETWVRPADEEGLSRARAIVGGVARLVYPQGVEFERGAIPEPIEAAAAIIARHPMSDDELRRAMASWGVENIEATIRMMESSGKGVKVERHGTIFWRVP